MTNYAAQLMTLSLLEQEVHTRTAKLTEDERLRIAFQHEQYAWSREAPDTKDPAFHEWKYHWIECLSCVTYVVGRRRQALLQEKEIDELTLKIFEEEMK